MRPDVQFEWRHSGDGGEREVLTAEALATFPANAVAQLPGYPGPAGLMSLYRDEPIDAFVNASASEGTPVAVMEAMSCGIPVVVTAVGGNVDEVRCGGVHRASGRNSRGCTSCDCTSCDCGKESRCSCGVAKWPINQHPQSDLTFSASWPRR